MARAPTLLLGLLALLALAGTANAAANWSAVDKDAPIWLTATSGPAAGEYKWSVDSFGDGKFGRTANDIWSQFLGWQVKDVEFQGFYVYDNYRNKPPTLDEADFTPDTNVTQPWDFTVDGGGTGAALNQYLISWQGLGGERVTPPKWFSVKPATGSDWTTGLGAGWEGNVALHVTWTNVGTGPATSGYYAPGDSNDLNEDYAPEPASIALLGAVGAAGAFVRRRRAR